ncbi:hypothetical protein GCM10025869_14940 [Homoserinibacter gongjuensis]|uniref:Uncharacterized protein n=1 Tax=Homoserinibacter gongjuensis TaxID=1162968 RepID=A0ABQ6JUL1_9MICO|nr:hypothetical protein GCM10025869_14940 [Homoserinibacter gongjuensis]
MPLHGADAREGGREVGLEYEPPALGRHAMDEVVARRPRVVDEHVDAAVGCRDPVDEPLDCVGVGHVGDRGLCRASRSAYLGIRGDECRLLRSGRLVEIDDDDRGALSREAGRGRRADTPGGSRDDGRAAGEAPIHLRPPREGLHADDVAADDERLDGVGALVRRDDLHVGEVPGHVVLEQEPVAAEQLAGLGAHPAGALGGVHLRERRHRAFQATRVGELRHAQAVELHRRDLGEHLREAMLHELVLRDGTSELAALSHIARGDLVGGHRVAERLPRGAAARAGEHAPRVAERAGSGEVVVGGDAHAVDADVGLLDRALADLAADDARLESARQLALGVALDDERLDAGIRDVAGPHDDDVGAMGVADPALLPSSTQ